VKLPGAGRRRANTDLSIDIKTLNPGCLMQPRMTSRLCLKRSLDLRSSTFNSTRLWQQRFFNSIRVLVPAHQAAIDLK
jgi:hypothetical protein